MSASPTERLAVRSPVVPAPAKARASLRTRLARVNFARLNHILIPSKKPERDALRRRSVGTFLSPVFWFVSSLSREGRAFIVLTLLVGAAGVDVGTSEVYWLFAGMVGLLAAAFATRPLYRLRASSIAVMAPYRVSAHEPQTFTVVVRNDGSSELTSLRIERPFLPWDGKWIGEPIGIPHVDAGGSAEVRTQAVFVERGEHHLDAFEMARLVPAGLAVGRRVSSSGCRFLVLPRLANVVSVTVERKRSRADGRRIARPTPGEDDLAGIRPYVRGDPLKHLHVRTWARTGIPHVRQYSAESADGVLLVVALDAADASEHVVEGAISLAAGVAARLVEDGTGVDHLVLGGDVVPIAPRRGRPALDAILDALAKVNPSNRTADVLSRAQEIAPSIASAIVVCADDDPRRRELVEGLARAGVPVKVLTVQEDETAAGSTFALSRITNREPIAC